MNTMVKMKRKYVLVRDNRAGVYLGELDQSDPAAKTARLVDARHIHYWRNRLSTADIAARGIGAESRVAAAVPAIDLFDVIAVIECTATAEKSAREFVSWSE